jgi:predicted 3-demethylubiquinone-9 3-methyltransferase (glyoxalase superfamily)
MQKITPFLWFKDNAEDAANFYVSVFKNSKITTVMRYGDAGPGPKGAVMLVNFELDGGTFTALNGNTEFSFNHAVSLVVHCDDQAEIDDYWQALTADGGSEVACGWLTDKFGFSWQITPKNIGELIRTPAQMQAMMKMKKLDIATLKAAGESH